MIKSAIVPVAGVGTRLLPATKSQPKEMLPVARKPIVQYVVEELVQNGIEQILFVTGRNKASIENHFDHDPELVRTLTAANKKELLEELGFEELQAHFFYTRQRLQKGLGRRHSVWREFRWRGSVSGGAGRFHPGSARQFQSGHAHGRSFRIEARQLRHRRGRSAARGDQPLRNRAAGDRAAGMLFA